MCIDIVDVLGTQPCIIECQLHALCLILAVRRRARDMIAVRVRAVADKLCVDMRTARLGVFERLEHDQPCALAHDEPRAVLVKGTRSVRRIVIVIRAERLHRRKARTRRLGDARLRAARDHDIRLAALHDAIGVTDTVRARGARRHDAGHGAVQTVVDRNLPRCHVGDHHGDEKGADTLGALFKETLIGAVHRLDAADARADIGADAVTVLLIEIEPRILQCHARRDDGKLRIAIHALGFLLVDVTVNGKILDLAGNLRGVACRVEAGNAADAVLSCEKRIPERLLADADRCDRADPRNDYPLFQTNRLLSANSLLRAAVSAPQISHEHS